MNYLDTSALVKRFVAEKGTEFVIALTQSGEPVGTSKIAYAEVFSGLARRRRASELPEAEYASACERFEADWRLYLRVDLRDDVLVLARALIERHPLRGFDAIHLASAISLGTDLEEEVAFVAADTRLLQAATGEGLRALNPED